MCVCHFLAPAGGKQIDFLKNLESGGCESLTESLTEFQSKEFQSDSAFKISSIEIRALLRPVLRLEILV